MPNISGNTVKKASMYMLFDPYAFSGVIMMGWGGLDSELHFVQVAVPKPKAEKKKEKPKKATSDEGVLSDPLAEKLRQQRYQVVKLKLVI